MSALKRQFELMNRFDIYSRAICLGGQYVLQRQPCADGLAGTMELRMINITPGRCASDGSSGKIIPVGTSTGGKVNII